MASTEDMDVPALSDDDMEKEVEGIGWDDDGDDDENEDLLLGPVKCLFCDRILNSAEEVFSHCLSDHSFNVHSFCGCWSLGSDCIGYIKLINFIRTQCPTPDALWSIPREGPAPWNDDTFMQPADPEDLLLQYDIEEADCSVSEVSETSATPSVAGAAATEEATLGPRSAGINPEQLQAYLIQRLQDTESSLERALGDLNQMKEKVRDLLVSDDVGRVSSKDGLEGADCCDSSIGAVQRLTLKEDEAYFSSYDDYNIHLEMLQDKVRSESYRDFILGNPGVFQDKIVLDIGCGTGILSMFAAKAGAKHVIGVDQSEIIYQAMDIVRENGLEKKVTFLKGRMEEVELPYDKVDVIISEWMGYFLLFESMLDTVIVARNHHLSPDGCVYPDKCSMWMAGFSDSKLHASIVDFWDDVYGFKMSCIKPGIIEQTFVDIMPNEKLITEPSLFKEIDVNTCSLSDVDFTSSFTMTCCKDGVLHGLVGYFDIGFEAECTKQVYFSTGPGAKSTHWKQTLFYLKSPVKLTRGATVEVSITVKKNRKDPRSLRIRIILDGKTQDYSMS